MVTLELETAVSTEHHLTHIAGLDEAGRGALAGPVVAAAVILPRDDAEALAHLRHVNDSKLLSPDRRDALYELIVAHALAYGVGQTRPEVIDAEGIIPATKQAMAAALSQLAPAAEFLLIDGRIHLRHLSLPQKSIVRGDRRSLSIAAASILAKVSRDRQMIALAEKYPAYGFARHKGYGTRRHREAIVAHGPCAIHRHSFSPIRQRLVE